MGHRAVLASASVLIGFASWFAYTSWNYSNNLLQRDQWLWVNLLFEYETGQRSFFETLTYEYEVFNHGHIPTLATLFVNYRFFGLQLWLDSLIGFFAVLATVAIVVRSQFRSLPRVEAAVASSVAGAILLTTSWYRNFTWSLLQFQWVYILVAVAYACSHYILLKKHPFVHAVVVIPLVLLLGDAIGSAAVVAGLVYTIWLAFRRDVSSTLAVATVASVPVTAILINQAFRGEQDRGSTSVAEFIEFAVSSPEQVLQALRNGIAMSYFLVPRNVAGIGVPGVTIATIVALGVLVTFAFALWLGRATPRAPTDHFALVLVGTSIIWMAGVLKARVVPSGPDEMLTGRYATYTALAGLGCVLFIAGRIGQSGRPQLRRVFILGAVGIVAMNAVLSIVSTLFVAPDKAQELAQHEADLRELVFGTSTVALTSMEECQMGFCQNPAFFLHDEQLNIFRDEQPPRPAWRWTYRSRVEAKLPNAPGQRTEACRPLVEATEAERPGLIRALEPDSPFFVADLLAGVESETAAPASSGQLDFAVAAAMTACGQPTPRDGG